MAKLFARTLFLILAIGSLSVVDAFAVTYSADRCTGGTSSASSCLQGCSSAYSQTKAFDDVFNVWDGWVAAGVTTGWVQYEFSSAKTIAKYTINPRGATAGNPKNWTFEAYDDATSQWVVLDTRSNQTWTYQVTKEFTFSNSTAYTKYRLNISANGGHSEVGFTEMEMMEIIPDGPPSAITDLDVTAGNGEAVLTWTEPSNNGAAITGYEVQYGTVSSGVFGQTHQDDSTPGATVTGLTNGTNYQFRVVATNSYGDSDPSNVETAIPQAPPVYSQDRCAGGTSSASSCHQGCGGTYSHTKAFDDLTNTIWVTAASQSGWLQYEFTSPKTIAQYTIYPRDLGSSNPKNWTFEGFDDTSSQWVVLDTRTNETWTAGVRREFILTNTNAYSKYRINISANYGHVDMGLHEMEMMETIQPGPPSTIADLEATAGDGEVVLNWSEPDDGGAAITSYQVQYGTVPSGLFNQTYQDDASPGATVTGLTNNTEYQFRVIATNANGDSDPSNVETATPETFTPVSGTISTNTTWTLTGSPYLIESDISITNAAVLTIEPGVTVLFDGNFKIDVTGGSIAAQGTSGNQIVFTSNMGSQTAGDWKTIHVHPGQSGAFDYCRFEFAQSGLTLEGTSPAVSNSVFEQNQIGIKLIKAANSSIHDNTIHSNTLYGIQVVGEAGVTPNPVINNNAIEANGVFNLHATVNGTNFNQSDTIIDAELNWWGSDDTDQISSKIRDYYDDPLLPRVDFAPYLTSEPGLSISISNNSVTPRVFDPAYFQTAQINYTLDTGADVTIKIYDETGAQVRTLINAQFRSGGANNEQWDGKDNLAQVLPEGVYTYIIEAQGAGGQEGRYDPILFKYEGPVLSNVSAFPSGTFSPAKGERLEISYELEFLGLVTLTYNNTPVFMNQPRNAGAGQEVWDGRDAAGNLVISPDLLLLRAETRPIPENAIIIQNGSTLDISALTTDPYVIRPVYSEVTEISYSINESAEVTVSILTPDGSQVLDVLESGLSKSAGTYTLEWDGRTSTGETIAEEGDYRVRVEAVDAVGTTQIRYGNIRILY